VDEKGIEEDPDNYFNQYDKVFQDNVLQVVDINLARKNIGDVAILTKLEEKS
jgi:hypothetical protein